MNIKNVLWFVLGTVGIMGLSVLLLWQFGSASGKPIEGVAGERLHAKGSGSIEIVEFSDFQCPACMSIQAPLQELLTKYGEKISFVYRHFPLTTIHPFAMQAAYASEAAGKQGKFFEMHDMLFARQASWSTSNPESTFVTYAKELGLDTERFVSDMKSKEVKDIVSNDSLAATRFRIRGTPTFFVNGVETPFEEIETKLR
jgi:protein-disulfide isomerase